MEDYEMITRLGGGSFADVYKAREKSTGELVAIKILKKKYKKWEECIELRECKSLQILNKASLNEKGIDNIIKLKRIIFINKTGVLNLVFEFMEKDLLYLMKSYEPNRLPESKIKDIIHQTLLGLAYMHKYGFFHRDLKPENLLLVGDKIKIADFGLAREIRSIPPYTEYVSTRYYRAPECILKSTNYNSPIDIWALGCVMAEMYLHPQPLFYGSNEKEVLFRICSILGTPTYDSWPDGIQQANYVGIKFPNSNKTDLEKIIPNASPEAIDLMNQMLKWDPNNRATASSLLNHPFFENYRNQNKFTSNISDYSNVDFTYDNSKVFYDNNSRNKNEKIDITKNINNISKISKISEINDNRDNNFKMSNNFELNDSLLLTNKKLDNNTKNETENKNEEDNFSKMLNDTDGFNKLINQLKQEKIEEDRNFEKEKNNLNNLWVSIEKKLDINVNESKIGKFNESHKKEEKQKEFIPNSNGINKDNQSLFSLLDDLNLNSNSKNKNDYEKKNLDNNITPKKSDMKIGEAFNRENLTNKDNNDEFGFDNAIRLKPMIKNNRRGSARKFLEEHENDMKVSKIENNNNINNNINNNNERKLKYNFSNNLLHGLDFDTKEYAKPTIVKNEFSFVGNLNGIFDNPSKKPYDANNNYNGFKKRDFNYGRNVTITNNNLNSPYYRNKNQNNDNFLDNNSNLKRGPSFYQKESGWNL